MRTASFAFQDWPRGARPIRVALIADPHLQGPDMPPARIARIAAQVALQKPDLILLAGDFVGDRALGTRIYSDAEIAAALRHFRPPLGTWAVLGNHDHWRDGASMRRALEAVGIPVLDNRAIRLGPLTLAGAGISTPGMPTSPRSRARWRGCLDRPCSSRTAPMSCRACRPDSGWFWPDTPIADRSCCH